MTSAPAVASLRASAYTVPTDRPEADGTLAWDSTTIVVVEAEAGSVTGLGWTYAPAVGAQVVTDLLAPAVTGRPALDPEDSWSAMVRAVRNAGRPGLVGCAISATDIALWDLAARLRGVPLVELWDQPARPVEVYGSGGFTTYDDATLEAQLRGWLDLGCRRVKIKIGESWGTCTERDLERAARAAVVTAGEAELMVDANGAYDVEQACTVGRRLDALGVTWLEEPVSSDDHEGLTAVREHLRADVAAGEYGWDLAGLVHLAPHVDCLQVDVTRCGGYTEWRRVAADPRLAGVDLSGHCAPYASLPVAATTPQLRHVEYFHDHVRIERRFFDGCVGIRDGRLVVPDGPGHGLSFRRGEAEQHRVA
ncbi:enolase C-terminal domain-like protein [Nocardioides marmoribigeumensis]|uniref:L-alanine-DL-glutamate epimerase-like enolase superfamily enzyme n=1 Tax=Nocardioides marmoribigeumensis TaxID=433649 RepID=A0ABU2BXR5_9ACTN|nr:enolase C-terminal domain-like protein [Nocardioides marmoribigeumensis]MDR7363203.1 L-alanine-DL-glutamate epimerase-like enolase superfamily enzyme [Nocardioides marmoribigeumensis]